MDDIHFGEWDDEVHLEEKQKRSIERARKWDCAPVPGSLDKEDQRCVFHGDHGDYDVSLGRCNCGAFRGKAPCKHIYRLAAELGLIDIQMQEGRGKRDLADGMFKLTPAAQAFLYHHVRYAPRMLLVRTPELTEIALDLVTHGFFMEQVSEFALFAKKAEFEKADLIASGLPGFDGLRSDRRAYIKVIAQLEKDGPALLREKLLCLEATEATVNATNTIETRFRKKFKKLGEVEDPYTGFFSPVYEEHYDNNPA